MNAPLRKLYALAVAAVMFGAASAHASAVYISKGQTKVVNLAAQVKAARAEDGSLVDVKKRAGGQIVVRGLELGRTELRLRMADGEEYTMALHVVPEGTVIYNTGRGENTARLTPATYKAKRATPATKPHDADATTPAVVRDAPVQMNDADAPAKSDAAGDSLDNWARGNRR